MPLASKRVVPAQQSAQYNGTNSADLATEISDFTVNGETAAGLVFTSAGQQYTIARNGYLTWSNGRVDEVFQNADDYGDAYTELDQAMGLDHVHAITTGPGHLM